MLATPTQHSLGLFWRAAWSRPTIMRAVKIGGIIGTLQVVINHGDTILAGGCVAPWKIALTYFLPATAAIIASATTSSNSTYQQQ